jgi:hypothetical protein
MRQHLFQLSLFMLIQGLANNDSTKFNLTVTYRKSGGRMRKSSPSTHEVL